MLTRTWEIGGAHLLLQTEGVGVQDLRLPESRASLGEERAEQREVQVVLVRVGVGQEGSEEVWAVIGCT